LRPELEFLSNIDPSPGMYIYSIA